MSITVFIPCHNEVAKVFDIIDRIDQSYRVVIINTGTDVITAKGLGENVSVYIAKTDFITALNLCVKKYARTSHLLILWPNLVTHFGVIHLTSLRKKAESALYSNTIVIEQNCAMIPVKDLNTIGMFPKVVSPHISIALIVNMLQKGFGYGCEGYFTMFDSKTTASIRSTVVNACESEPFSIIVPTKNPVLLRSITGEKGMLDEVIAFPGGSFKTKMKSVLESTKYNNIIVISPSLELIDGNLLHLRTNYAPTKIGITNFHDGTPSDLSCLSFSADYAKEAVFSNYVSFCRELIGLHPDSVDVISYVDETKVSQNQNHSESAMTGKSGYQQIYPFKDRFNISEMPKEHSISIIVPFCYSDDRFKIFKATMSRLHSLIKGNDNIELCIHESAPKRRLTDKFLDSVGARYMYTKWTEVFHRSWNLNVAARYLASKNYFVFFDCDMLVDEEWLNVLLNTYGVGHGWNELLYINEDATNIFLETRNLHDQIQFMRKPELDNCAGGINVIPRDVFFYVYGWPEDFRGFYGGPDNALWAKLKAYGMYNLQMPVRIRHLYHAHTISPKQGTSEYSEVRAKRRAILDKMYRWSKDDWQRHLQTKADFGDISQAKEVFIRV